MSSTTGNDHHSFIKIATVISACLFIAAFLLIIYEANYGGFLFDSSFGPGAYYYTDVPGWQHIFLESPFLGFAHPVLCFGFFIAWAVLMYRVLIWLNDKL